MSFRNHLLDGASLRPIRPVRIGVEPRGASTSSSAFDDQPPFSIEQLRERMRELKISPPDPVIIAVWGLASDDTPLKLETDIGRIYVVGRAAFRRLEQEAASNAPVSMLSGALAGRTFNTLGGIPIVDIDEGGETALRVLEAIKVALAKYTRAP